LLKHIRQRKGEGENNSGESSVDVSFPRFFITLCKDIQNSVSVW
jgi:hypothetical protein